MAVKHFYEQEKYTEEYLIPYLSKSLDIFHNKDFKLLDVGCAEGGSIAALNKQGFHCDGIEIMKGRAKIAREKNSEEADIYVADITKIEEVNHLKNQYDIIIMRDAIEHIVDKPNAFKNLHALLRNDGFLFITFPLKYSPYAGHQQASKTWIKYMPYIMLYPAAVGKFLCKAANEERRIESLSYLRKCSLTYRKFKKLTHQAWSIHDLKFFLSRPVYKQRFGWPIIEMFNIPGVRELANGCEVILKKN